MKTFPLILLLGLAVLGVFVEATFELPRRWLGSQIDILTPLMVCCAIMAGVWEVALFAVVGGLLLDSLSANPLGLSVLPLFWTGLVLERLKDLLLRDLAYAQAVLGGLAAGVVMLLKLGLLLTLGETPLVGWSTGWHLLVNCAGGVVLTPLLFRMVTVLCGLLAYQPSTTMSFRSDREIKRGRT
ncbi:MAG: hypothetical protein ACYDC1_25435 [Limisphaerales bacterium]